MNLQTIQKRVEELSAELLTLSNDLSHLIQGEVVRQPATLARHITHWSQLKVNDRISVSHKFEDCVTARRDAGTYTVAEVEPYSYAGEFQVALRSGGGLFWLRFDEIRNCVVVN
jgi:hypothetical protein